MEREEMSGSLDKLIVSEFLNGEISGIRLFTLFPQVLVDEFSEQLDELREELNNGESSNTD